MEELESIEMQQALCDDEVMKLVEDALAGSHFERAPSLMMSFKLLQQIADAITSSGLVCNEPKQVTLARVYSTFIGVSVPSERWALEKIGNRLQWSLAEHAKRLQKARHGKSSDRRAGARRQAEERVVPLPFSADTFKRVLPTLSKETVSAETTSEDACVQKKRRKSADAQLVTENSKSWVLLPSAISVPDTAPRIVEDLPVAEALRVLAAENACFRQIPADISRQLELRREAQKHAADVSEKAKVALREAECSQRKANAATALARKESERASKKAARADAEVKKIENLKGEHARLSSQVAAAHMEAARLLAKKNAEVAKLQRQFDTLQTKLENVRRLKNEANARARKAEKCAIRSELYLERAQEAEAVTRDLQLEYEALHEQYENASTAVAAASRRSESDCIIAEHAARDDRGRFGKVDHGTRVLIMGELARMTPPSAVALNLSQAAREFAPSTPFREPSYALVTNIRIELGIVGEMLAALQVADAAKVVSFGWDESTKLQIGILSTNSQIVPGQFCSRYMTQLRAGQKIDVVLRGACVIPGGTAQQVAQALESKFFARGRRLLSATRDVHEEMHGRGSWQAAGAPNPSQLGAHQLGNDCVLVTDTCNAARATRELFATAVEASIQASYGTEAWAAFTDEEKTVKTRIHMGDCHQHMRNIFLEHMAEAAASHLKDDLSDALEAFSAYDRMSTDGMQLIRAVYKEMHPTGEYYKGKGREFESWRVTNYASSIWVKIENAHGSRQDLNFDGMLPIFVNRPLLSRFLRKMLTPGDSSNILEQYLWAVLNCLEMQALIRACTLIDLLISRPLRWLAGKSSELPNWSTYKMGWALSLVEQTFVRVAADGKVLLDDSLHIFSLIEEDQPDFKEWQEQQLNRVVKSPDGSLHKVYLEALNEARTPKLQSNKDNESETILLLEVMAAAALKKLHDPKLALSSWLPSQGGAKAFEVNQGAHLVTVNAHATNDRVESNFGCFDYYFRRFRGVSVEAASAVSQQMRMHYFDPPSTLVSDRRTASKPKPVRGEGFFYQRRTFKDVVSMHGSPRR